MVQYLKIILCTLACSSLYALDPNQVKHHKKGEITWSLSADYVALFQANTGQSSNAIVSVTDGNSVIPYETMLTAEDLTNSFTSALQACFSIHTSPLMSLDLHFLGWANWREKDYTHSEASTLVTNWSEVADYYDWSQAANVSGVSHQEFDCIDLGLWFHSAPRGKDYFRISAYGGPRYIFYGDHLNMTSQRSSDISNAYMACRNNYAGAAVGLEFEASPVKWFSWAIRTLGGMYADFAHKNNTLYDYNDSVLAFNYNLSTVDIAYTIEISPMISLRAGRHVEFRMSYLAFFLANVAISSYQISPDITNSSIWLKSSFVIQGGTAGLAYTY